HQLVQALYSRTTADFGRGNFRVTGDTVDINLSYADFCLRVQFFGDEIESIATFQFNSGKTIEKFKEYMVYPANIFVTAPETLQGAIRQIQEDMVKQVQYFNDNNRPLEAKRLEERVNQDMEM